MRKFTKGLRHVEKPTTRDMKVTDLFRIGGYPDWWHRVDDAPSGDIRIASLSDGSLRTRGRVDVVSEVLADNETLTIGPEAKDG